MSMTREEAVAAYLKDRTLVQKVTFDDHWVSACWHDLDPSNAWHSNNYRLTPRPVPPGDLTLEEAKAAFAAGKPVQWYHKSAGWMDQRREKPPGSDECDPIVGWRLKPGPKLVPLGPEDVPPGSVVKANIGDGIGWCAIGTVLSNKVSIHTTIGQTVETWDGLMKHWLISTDAGKTWRPCSKQEVAS